MKTCLTIALAGLLCATDVSAGAVNLMGQWQVTLPHNPAYIGVMLIDAESRATWDSPKDNGRPAKFIGYVAQVDDVKAAIKFTDRTAVVQINCAIMSSDLLHCQSLFRDGAISKPFVVTRIGPGPIRLMPVHQ